MERTAEDPALAADVAAAIAIARRYALDARRAFNRCGPRSQALVRALQRHGIRARLEHGVFWPVAPVSAWHPRWQEIGHGEKFHYWVVVGTTILDPTAAQFGDDTLVIASAGDSRYAPDGDLWAA